MVVFSRFTLMKVSMFEVRNFPRPPRTGILIPLRSRFHGSGGWSAYENAWQV
jgi:hypothetical protein